MSAVLRSNNCSLSERKADICDVIENQDVFSSLVIAGCDRPSRLSLFKQRRVASASSVLTNEHHRKPVPPGPHGHPGTSSNPRRSGQDRGSNEHNWNRGQFSARPNALLPLNASDVLDHRKGEEGQWCLDFTLLPIVLNAASLRPRDQPRETPRSASLFNSFHINCSLCPKCASMGFVRLPGLGCYYPPTRFSGGQVSGVVGPKAERV